MTEILSEMVMNDILRKAKYDIDKINNILININNGVIEKNIDEKCLSDGEIERCGKLAAISQNNFLNNTHAGIYALNHKVSENDLILMEAVKNFYNHIADYFLHKHTSEPTLDKEDKRKVHLSWAQWSNRYEPSLQELYASDREKVPKAKDRTE